MQKNAFISPSIMCADLMELKPSLKILEQCGADFLHIDVMDGCFVPNYSLGTDFIKQLRKATAIPLDIHLMVENPAQKLAYFPIAPGDIVSIHVEAERHVQRALTYIKSLGAKAAVALNPATTISTLDYITDDLDMVLLMTVNPGFAGQSLIPAALHKIAQLKQCLEQRGRSDILIEVDGNVSFENAEKMAKAGANVFVAGSSSVYSTDADLETNFKKMRSCIVL